MYCKGCTVLICIIHYHSESIYIYITTYHILIVARNNQMLQPKKTLAVENRHDACRYSKKYRTKGLSETQRIGGSGWIQMFFDYFRRS